MKGIVFNLLAEAISAEYGEESWDDLLDAACLEGSYTSLGNYADEELFALVTTASAIFGTSESVVLRWFGRKAMPLLAQRYGTFFEPHKSARTFVRSLNDIIHPEVRKLYPGAGCPHFLFQEDTEGRLLIGYRSPRRLCHLAEGFIEGAADHFHEAVEIEHLSCMKHGSPTCRLSVRWVQ